MSITPDPDRLRGVARLLAGLGEPPSLEQLGNQVCRLAQLYLQADAAAFFIGADDAPRLIAIAGAPPELPLTSLAVTELDRLRETARSSGFARVELAPLWPLSRDGHPAGLLALLSSTGAPLAAADLETLGAGIAQALAHVRTSDELTRAFAKQDREQDQLVRAERVRALGDMALGIAHDFNNVLNAILGQTGILYELITDPAARAALDKLRKVALDGAATIGRVQEFSGERRDREFADVDAAALIELAVESLRAQAPPNVEVLLTLDDGARRNLRGNREELGEMLRAVADNALEAMPSGGRLTFALQPSGPADLVILVGDNGIGMSASVRRRVFDPFFTTKGSRTKGLGLSVAHGIARRHGGTIEIDSAPGEGSRVRIKLPSLVTATATSVNVDPPGQARNGAVRVLLVEDDPDNRDAMASLLSLSGFEVTPADCGSAGVRAFAPGRFDVVLTDLGLPDMDGWQVAGEIKQLAPSMPIALITGWGLNLDADEIRRRGVDLLIKKPLDPRAFLKQLEDLVQVGARKPSA